MVNKMVNERWSSFFRAYFDQGRKAIAGNEKAHALFTQHVGLFMRRWPRREFVVGATVP